jgi:hypothetical protein
MHDRKNNQQRLGKEGKKFRGKGKGCANFSSTALFVRRVKERCWPSQSGSVT